jgi:hypothetical protein
MIADCHPERAREVGIVELGGCRIGVCTQSFGAFLGVKPNTVNKNLRQHAFKRIGQVKENKDLPPAVPGLGHLRWSVWENRLVPFTRSVTTEQIMELVRHGSYVRSGRVFSPLNAPGEYGEMFYVSRTENSGEWV